MKGTVPAARASPVIGRWPDFYIVGAPRCGTTYLWYALRQHPQLFMPAIKEPLYFCSDLDTGSKADGRHFIRDADTYLALFRDAPAGALIGEANPHNLFSTVAARRIHEVRPDARIIISLREPVDQMVSFHQTRHAELIEDLTFDDAIAAEADRARGLRLPRNSVMPKAFGYRAVARYADQVERYLDLFGREHVLVIFFEDLRKDSGAVLRRIFRFLGVDSDAVEPPPVINPRMGLRSERVARVFRSAAIVNTAKRVVPEWFHPVASRLVVALAKLNQTRTEPQAIDSEMRRRLSAELEPDVERLGKLLDVDPKARWG